MKNRYPHGYTHNSDLYLYDKVAGLEKTVKMNNMIAAAFLVASAVMVVSLLDKVDDLERRVYRMNKRREEDTDEENTSQEE